MPISETLLAREDELAEIDRWLAEAADGRGRMAWIEGEAGIGKTAISEAARSFAADRGFLIQAAAAAELAGGNPFGVAAECLEATAASSDDQRVEVATALAAEPEGGLTPGSPPTIDGAGREQWLVEQLFSIVEDDCARQPVLIVIDDVHWADPSSLGFLARLARSTPDLPLLVLATVRRAPRPERIDSLVSASLAVGAELMELGPLDERSMIELAGRITGSVPGPSLLAQLGSCGGNPLFATELLQALVAEGDLEEGPDGLSVPSGRDLPENLAEILLSRVRLLGDETRNLLELATIIGQSFTIVELSLLADRATGSLWPDLRTALESGFIVESGDRLAFRHQVVREALYANLPEATRAALHLELGRALAAGNAPAGRVAEHLALGAQPGDQEAVAWLERAAREAAMRGPEVAVGLLNAALEIADPGDPVRGRLTAELAFDLLAAGRREEGEELCRHALEEGSHPASEGALRLCLTESLMVRGQLADALEEAGRAASSPELSEAEQAHATAWLSLGPLHAGDLNGARELGEAARAQGERGGSVIAQVKGLVSIGMAAGMTGELEEQERALAEAARLTERSPSRSTHAAQPHVMHAIALAALDRFEEARRQISYAGRAYRRLGMQSQLPFVHLLDGYVLFQMDAWSDALVEFEASSHESELSGAGWQLDGLGGRAVTYARRAEVELAEQMLAAMERGRASGASEFRGYWQPWARALISEARGDLSGAADPLFEFWQGLCAARLDYEAFLLAGDLGRMLAALGSRDRLQEVASAAESLARRNPEPATLHLTAKRVRALADADIEALIEVAEMSRSAARPYEAVAGAEAAAGALAAAGRLEEAESWGREAVEAADEIGAERDADRVRATLRAVGIRLIVRGRNARETSGWDSLTPSELRIADLVSEGLSNPQIADRLMISKRTVSTHVSNILRKLSLTSRVQLAAMAAEARTLDEQS